MHLRSQGNTPLTPHTHITAATCWLSTWTSIKPSEQVVCQRHRPISLVRGDFPVLGVREISDQGAFASCGVQWGPEGSAFLVNSLKTFEGTITWPWAPELQLGLLLAIQSLFDLQASLGGNGPL